MRDYNLGDTVFHKFTTRAFATGIPTTLGGTPAVVAYEDAVTTEITAGITLIADFDSKTGLNHVAVAATSGNGYGAGKTYHLVISAGTVGGVSVVGEVVGEFTLKGEALKPATAGRDINISAAGAVEQVENLQVAGPGSIAPLSFQANAITNGAIATDAIGADEFAQGAADKVWSSTTRTLTAFSTALAVSVWDVLESAVGAASSIGLKVKTNLDATVSSRSMPSDPVNLNADQSTVTIGTVNALGAQAKSDVADAVIGVNNTALSLPGQAAPPGSPTPNEMWTWLYKVMRNRKQQTATEWRLLADNETTVDAKATVSDDGTTATKQEIVSGP